MFVWTLLDLSNHFWTVLDLFRPFPTFSDRNLQTNQAQKKENKLKHKEQKQPERYGAFAIVSFFSLFLTFSYKFLHKFTDSYILRRNLQTKQALNQKSNPKHKQQNLQQITGKK